ncbi:putative F-box protein At3g16210 [Papaver somniferum]|uniref:putative F-box protein At3g16210 n=1 Tax=Papaver somniferum TaxID=3469 RepID=UPI000E6FF193|nr:putative F-box protein At3g16210 [Papaver somniferum]
MEMDYPLKSDGFAVSFLGSCNGLVCLRLSHPLRKLCCIWNPVSKEYKEIPEPPDASGPFDFSCFGYDPKTDDYKLVIGEHIYISISRIQVYSLRSNSWESSIPVPYRFCNEFNGVGAVLVHGNLHWLADDDYQNQFVVSFDIIEEHFEKLQLPKQPLKNKNWFISLGVLAGCLCVLVEVVQSGEILFWVTGNIVIYDPKNRSVVETNLPSSIGQEMCYFESLVSLNSGTPATLNGFNGLGSGLRT